MGVSKHPSEHSTVIARNLNLGASGCCAVAEKTKRQWHHLGMRRRRTGRIVATGYVDAPPERVWSLMCDSSRLLEWNSELADVRDATPTLDHPGARYAQVWRILGRERLGRMEIVAVDPGRGREVRGTLPVGAAFSGRDLLEPSGGGTKISVQLDYEIPWGVLGRVLHPVAHRMSARMFARNARNLDALLTAES